MLVPCLSTIELGDNILVAHVRSTLAGIVCAGLAALSTRLVGPGRRTESFISLCATIPLRYMELGCLVWTSGIGVVSRGLGAVRLLVLVWRARVLAVLGRIVFCPTWGSRWVGRILIVRIGHFETRGIWLEVG